MEQEQIGYRGLMVWQKADELAFNVFRATQKFPKEELYGLTSQMRRSAISVPANIVEGYARQTKKDKINFFVIARGSLAELEYYIDFCHRLGFLTNEEHDRLVGIREEAGRLLHGFIRSQRL